MFSKLVLLIGVLSLGLSQQLWALEPTSLVSYRPSFKWYADQLQQGAEITQSFRENKLDQVDTLLLRNQPSYPQLLKEFAKSTPFLRGEIEDEKVLNSLITWLQLSILETRKYPSKALEIHQAWFQMAADLSYQESSLIGLKTSVLIRSLLMDELEKMSEVDWMSRQTEWMVWVQKLNMPWPIDRIILSEGKKFFSPVGVKVAQKVASALQKNPYQTTEDKLSKKEAMSENERAFLIGMWKKSDVEQMVAEVNRLGKLQIKWAQIVYQKKFGKSASQSQQLVDQKILFRLPIDYSTGKPM